MSTNTHKEHSSGTEKTIKTGVIVALATPQQPIIKTEEYVSELSFLAHTWGLTIVKHFIQRLNTPHNATFVGKGKAEEIAVFIQENNIDYVVFDDELSPSQVRNLEKLLSCQILDRNLLIFNIFSMRARTQQAKYQIELAQYQYLLPRLTRMWGHLSRQKGGSAGMRGPGEQELETDQRIIQDKIARLRARLVDIEHQCTTRRKGRSKFVRVAIVGYTNVGKSTLMKLLSKAEVLAEDKLFATLDSTVRKVVLDDQAFLLTDTIGFIRKLPHTLVECFKSTLEEIKEADLVLHVVDVSYPNCREQIEIVDKILAKIGAGNKPMIFVFNKVDAAAPVVCSETLEHPITTPETIALLQKAYKDILDNHRGIFISAKEQINIDDFKKTVAQEVAKIQDQRYIKNSY